MIIKHIELNPIQATAYFWVNTIKNKVRELSNIDNRTKNQLEFLNLFSKYTDIEWRNLYLIMISYIDDKINNQDYYYQDTSVHYHNDINEILNSVLKRKVPDISLSPQGMEDSITVTNIYGADRVYKISGIVPINTTFDSNYILTGDFKELKLNTLMMMLIANNKHNHSKNLLKRLFCEIYLQIYPNSDYKVIEEQFNRIFNQISDLQLIDNITYDQYNYNFLDLDINYLNTIATNDELSDIIKKVKIIKM